MLFSYEDPWKVGEIEFKGVKIKGIVGMRF
jgi:hypothetical protein